jgi:uncharacterized protein
MAGWWLRQSSEVTVPWLVRGDDVLAAAEVAVTRGQRRRGLIGRDGLEGVLVIRPCRQVHTFGMQFPIDVAFCDRYGFVLHTSRMSPRRVSRPVWRSFFAIEARAGAFDRWGLDLGDVVEVKG